MVPYSVSPAPSAALNVPLIVCITVFVIKSVLLVPVSALRAKPLIVIVGATVSSTYVWLSCAPTLPVASSTLTNRVLLPERVTPKLNAVCPVLLVAATQVVPLSRLILTTSPATVVVLSVPLMV